MLIRSHKGFTLLEVLIAALIAFAAISALTMVYRGALQASQKAYAELQVSGFAPHILDKINIEMMQKHAQPSVNGQFSLADIEVSWRAKLLSAVRSQPRLLGQEWIQPEHELKSWQVDVTLKVANITKELTYEETTW